MVIDMSQCESCSHKDNDPRRCGACNLYDLWEAATETSIIEEDEPARFPVHQEDNPDVAHVEDTSDQSVEPSKSEIIKRAEKAGEKIRPFGKMDLLAKNEAIAEAARAYADARYKLDFFKTSETAGIETVGTLEEHERAERRAFAQLKGVLES